MDSPDLSQIDEVVHICLTHGKYAVIDSIDYKAIKPFHWHFSTCGYATTTFWNDGKCKHAAMHRFLLGYPPKGRVIDHINGDKLDNRRHNLRICTHRQNIMNQKVQSIKKDSRYKGVCLHACTGKWRAQLYTGKKQYYLGLFLNEMDAATAYNDAAIKHFGEYALLNTIVF